VDKKFISKKINFCGNQTIRKSLKLNGKLELLKIGKKHTRKHFSEKEIEMFGNFFNIKKKWHKSIGTKNQ
jgi:predicted nucleic acid-binding OB-fold protein